jgi:hypothetical protein
MDDEQKELMEDYGLDEDEVTNHQSCSKSYLLMQQIFQNSFFREFGDRFEAGRGDVQLRSSCFPQASH